MISLTCSTLRSVSSAKEMVGIKESGVLINLFHLIFLPFWFYSYCKHVSLCYCRSCLEDWPLTSQLPKGLNDIPPENFKFSLDNIKKMQAQFSCIQKLGSKINNEQKNGNYSEVLALSIEFLNLLDDTIERPHQFFIMTSKTMNVTLWTLYGATDRWIRQEEEEEE
jgi:hypothetical protein